MSERSARTVRRCATVPAYLGAFALGTLLLPFVLPVAALVDALRGTRFALVRALTFVVFYFGCESAGILASAWLWSRARIRPSRSGQWWLDAHYRLQSWWASTLLAGAGVLFGLRFEVEGDDLVPRGSGPFLLLVRHVSIGDTLLAAVYLADRHGHRLRYVLKRELLWDPCLDIVGHRLPNCFVWRDAEVSGPEVARVRALAEDLGPNDGVLIYPEGTRFTPERRAALLRRFEEGGRKDLAAWVERLRHVLPPRPGGTLALLEQCPGADVIVCGHVGFEGTMRLSDLVSGALVGGRVRVRFWRVPASSIPGDREGRVQWLFERWAALDRWVESEGAG